MFKKKFWVDAAERACKTGAQFGLGAWGLTVFTTIGEAMNAIQLVGLAIGFGAGLSLLTSIASAPFGEKGEPSLVKIEK